ncbi:methyltransferase domain-containing protein [Streptomyces mayteni]
MSGGDPAGVAVPAEWRAAFAALPRAGFLPDLAWPHDLAADTFSVVDRAADPAAWQRAAAADTPIVTQWDDGRHTGPEPGLDATSSVSRPALVASMLGSLGAEPGMRVLEIGTGTGWNAALLAHRLGDENVTTVEVDPAVAAAAERALARAGRSPRVVTGDGALGVPDGAPFDRIIATCGLRRIPPAWLAQVRPGGVILAPWGTDFSTRDALARLTVRSDGTASGPFLELVAFMKLRAQRRAIPSYPGGLGHADSTTDAWPPHAPWHPFPFLAGLRIGGAAHAVQPHRDGHTQWLYSLRDDSWTAAVRRAAAGPRTLVRQAGPRRLWDELAAAHAWWTELGEPPIDHFGLTVAPDGTAHTWLAGAPPESGAG